MVFETVTTELYQLAGIGTRLRVRQRSSSEHSKQPHPQPHASPCSAALCALLGARLTSMHTSMYTLMHIPCIENDQVMVSKTKELKKRRRAKRESALLSARVVFLVMGG